MRRDWPLAKPIEDVAHEGQAQQEEPYEPEASFESDDVSEPSGTEYDYNDPEMVYEFRRRSRNEDLEDSEALRSARRNPRCYHTSKKRQITLELATPMWLSHSRISRKETPLQRPRLWRICW